MGLRLQHLAVRAGGLQRAVRARVQAAHDQAGGRSSVATRRPTRWCGSVNQGITDFIGAARPSIADPFLPRKIEEGRSTTSANASAATSAWRATGLSVPIRCTQNSSMGEEWRRGWHPERIAPKPADGADAKVLVVGAGPAGLEAALWLGRRGYEVVLTEASRALRRPGGARGQAARPGRVGPCRRPPGAAAATAGQRAGHAGEPDDRRRDRRPTTSPTSRWPPAPSWRADGLGRFHSAGVFTPR